MSVKFSSQSSDRLSNEINDVSKKMHFDHISVHDVD